MGRFLALLAALLIGGLIAWATQHPSRPRNLDAPAGVFSATRAFTDVQAMAPAPHPLGSAQNQRVRDYLLGRMAGLGLQPQVHADHAFAPADWGGGGGYVENLVGVLPGRDRVAPALMLMAHYDSVASSPGAADDAAGVAAVLETVRALQAQGKPARDVIVLITDGEEAGLLGARAFFRRDPLRDRPGFVINLEARGSSGRALMFQAGADDQGAIRLLRRTAVRPASSSLAMMIYRQTPNDTDFSEVLEAGVDGLNYAFVGRQAAYHSPTSTPADLDKGSLQDIGDQVLAAARAAAFDPALPTHGPNLVYSQLFGDVILAYPPAEGWLLLAVAAGLIALGVVQARRRGELVWDDVIRGVGAAAFALCGSGALLQAARRLTGAGFGFLEQRVLLAQAHRWEAVLILLGLGFLLLAAATLARGRRSIALIPLLASLVAAGAGDLDPVGLGLGLVAAAVGLVTFNRPVARPGGWAGVLLAGLAVAVLVQIGAPEAGFITAWPLLLAAVAAAATAMSARTARPWVLLLGAAAAIGIGWIGGWAHLAFLSLDAPLLLLLPLWITAPVLWPLAQPEEGAPPARLLGPLLLAAAVAGLAWVRFDPAWSAAEPHASWVAYHVDQDASRAWRVVDPAAASPWSDTLLRTGGGPHAYAHWAFGRPLQAQPAPFVAEAAPALAFQRRPDGDLTLTAAPPPGARLIVLRLRPDTPVRLLSISGAPGGLWLQPGAWTRIRWEGDPQGPVLVLRPAGHGRLEVRYAATLERWPATAPPLPPRPADVAPFIGSDATVVTGTRRFAW